jgi:hypothetical protein
MNTHSLTENTRQQHHGATSQKPTPYLATSLSLCQIFMNDGYVLGEGFDFLKSIRRIGNQKNPSRGIQSEVYWL